MQNTAQIKWGRIATVLAVVSILFLFTRSALLPAGTFWELSAARELVASGENNAWFPELLALNLVGSSSSLIGLKALHHILFSLICCGLTFYLLKGKEFAPGLLVLCLFALFAQSCFHIRHLFAVFLLLCFVLTVDSKLSLKLKGLFFFLITAVSTIMGIEGWLIVCFALFYFLFGNGKMTIPLLICVLAGYAVYPNGVAASFNYELLVNRNFVVTSDSYFMVGFAVVLFVFNAVLFNKIKFSERSILFFSLLMAVLTILDLKFAALFLFFEMLLFVKSCSKCELLSINIHISLIMILTMAVYYYLFNNSFGLNLNSNVNKQIGKNLDSITNGYESSLILESKDIGELIWKKIISFDKSKIETYFADTEWNLTRDEYGSYELKHCSSGNSNAM